MEHKIRNRLLKRQVRKITSQLIEPIGFNVSICAYDDKNNRKAVQPLISEILIFSSEIYDLGLKKFLYSNLESMSSNGRDNRLSAKLKPIYEDEKKKVLPYFLELEKMKGELGIVRDVLLERIVDDYWIEKIGEEFIEVDWPTKLVNDYLRDNSI